MRLAPTLVAGFACALAFAVTGAPADVAPQGAVGALDPASADRIYGAAYTEDDAKLSACATLWASANAGVTWTSAGGALPLVRKNCP